MLDANLVTIDLPLSACRHIELHRMFPSGRVLDTEFGCRVRVRRSVAVRLLNHCVEHGWRGPPSRERFALRVLGRQVLAALTGPASGSGPRDGGGSSGSATC